MHLKFLGLSCSPHLLQISFRFHLLSRTSSFLSIHCCALPCPLKAETVVGKTTFPSFLLFLTTAHLARLLIHGFQPHCSLIEIDFEPETFQLISLYTGSGAGAFCLGCTTTPWHGNCQIERRMIWPYPDYEGPDDERRESSEDSDAIDEPMLCEYVCTR